jgi:hypothetical protein
MKFEVTVPDDYAGGVINDLQRRGADITDMGAIAGRRVVKGNVALSKMFGYSTTLALADPGPGAARDGSLRVQADSPGRNEEVHRSGKGGRCGEIKKAGAVSPRWRRS